MQEIEVKSDESCALCIFKGETINALPLNWLIWGNRAVFQPFVLTRFWFNCLSLNEFLIDKSAWLLWREERCRKSWLGFLIVIPLGLYGRLQQLFEGGYHAKKFEGIDFDPKSRLKIGM